MKFPRKGHGLPYAQDGAIAEKPGKNPASGMVFGVNSGYRTVTGRTADDKRPLDLGKKDVYSFYTQSQKENAP
jgi:hypothetical protein